MHGNPDALLGHAGLRPHVGLVSHTMLDFGHVFVINGVLHFEPTRFLKKLKEIGLRYTHIDKWFRLLSWPSSEHHPPAKVFRTEHDKFKASSSECLNMYDIFCDFVQTFVKGDTRKNDVESLMSMFRILDAWKAIPADRFGSVSRGEQEIRRRHDLFFACYGREHVQPKRHRALHFGSMIRRHGRLQVCMVHERRHKQYKEIAINVKTCQRFDLTCTELLLNRQTNLMADDL